MYCHNIIRQHTYYYDNGTMHQQKRSRQFQNCSFLIAQVRPHFCACNSIVNICDSSFVLTSLGNMIIEI